MQRIFNFAAGPAVMPEQALRRAAEEMLNYRGSGMSVMEMSHRSAGYQEIFDHTVSLLRSLMDIPDTYEVLLLQGGATGQFAAAALNLLQHSADYVDSGHFAHGAMTEAAKYGRVRCAASTRETGYSRVPAPGEIDADPNADYLYITTNNTIYGTSFYYVPRVSVPIVADMSSNILSAPCDVRDYGVIFAGAQKNIGPAGLTVVIVRRDLLGRAQEITPNVLNWTVMAEKGSMLNTPPTYAVRLSGREPSVPRQSGKAKPFADERDLQHRRRRYRRRLRAGGRAGGAGLPEGPPHRGRNASQHLQRHAGRGRMQAGGIHGRL